MNKKQNIFRRFFGVILAGKTYLNLIYLFLALPLGLIYFLFLVVGLSVGFATLIILIGVALLAIVVAGWWGFANLERQMANHLLGESIPPLSSPEAPGKSLGESILAHFSNPLTWKSLLFLFLKFPAGIITFTVLALLFSITGFFSTAIITFSFFDLSVELTRDLSWQIDTIGEALLCLPLGILFGFISLHLCNLLARLSGRFTRAMLTASNQTAEQTTSIESSNTTMAPATPFSPVSTDAPSSEIGVSLPQATVTDSVNVTLSEDEPVNKEVTESPENLEDNDAWLQAEEEKTGEDNGL